MSNEENAIRLAVFDRLCSMPTGGEGQPPQGIVHAEDFSKVLQSLGLEFGHPVVDKIMTQCEMDEQGWVDYRAFGNDVNQQRQQQQQQQQQQPPPTRQPSSSGQSKPYHFGQPAPSTPQSTTPSQNTTRAIQQEQQHEQQRQQQSAPGTPSRQPPPQQQQRHQQQQPPPRAPQSTAYNPAALANTPNALPPPAFRNDASPNRRGSTVSMRSPDSAVRSQSNLVRSLTSQLSALYRKFDNGLCGVDVLRESLSRMGLEETPELRRLLRATPCEFSLKQLLQALTVKRVGHEITAPAGSLTQRTEGAIFSEGDMEGGEGFSGVRRGAPKMGVTHSGLDVVTWRDPKSLQDTQNTGSDALSGVGHRARGAYAAKVYHSDSVSTALRRGSYQPGSSWETTSRLQSSEAFPNNAVGRTPPRSSRSSRASNGRQSTQPVDVSGGPSVALKPQVYGAIRALDSSTITSDQFVQRLVELNVPISLSLERLLAKHRSNGEATFQDFVSSLQPYFNQIDRNYHAQRIANGGHQQQQQQHHQQQQQQQQPSSNGKAPLAMQTHGDILTWSGPKSGLERKAQTIGGARHNFAPHLKETPGLFSHGHQTSNEGGHASGRGGAHLHEQNFGSNDIIAWYEGDNRSRNTSSHHNQTLDGMVGNSGKQHYSTDKKMYGGSTPFGTDVDLGQGLDKNYGQGKQTRKGNVRAQRPHTGTWMTQQPGPAVQPRFRGVQAPFGTDIDVKR
jgi:hypothetical protein